MTIERTRILGVGTALPDRVVANQDLVGRMDTSDEWIQQRTGIRERRHVTANCGASDLGKIAAEEALRSAGLRVADIGLIVFATLSPDIDWPASACLLAGKIGAGNVPAFDVRNQCSGFIYGLSCADTLLRAGRARYALVVGGEIHSTGLDFTTRGREVGVIFGDGAGAVVVGASDRADRGILSTHMHAEGKYAGKLWLEAVASRRTPRICEQDLEGDDPAVFPRMEGKFVFRHAVTRFPEVIREALAANGLGIEDLDLLVPHQANLRINQLVAMGLGLDETRLVSNIERLGNTTAASIPIALSEALADGRIAPGKVVCLASFGAGFTWGAALLRW